MAHLSSRFLGVRCVQLLSVALVLGVISITPAVSVIIAPVMYGCTSDGELLAFDLTTGAGTLQATLPPTSPFPVTEIEYGQDVGAWMQVGGGANVASQFDITTGALIGAPVPTGDFPGWEVVGTVMFFAASDPAGGSSKILTLDLASGSSFELGDTGVGPIAGLAYDSISGIMYGIEGEVADATFLAIDLSNGNAIPLGATGIAAGSLEFGPGNVLYAGGAGLNAGNLFSINTADGLATTIGAVGFNSDIVGLALVPEPASIVLLSFAGAFVLPRFGRRKR